MSTQRDKSESAQKTDGTQDHAGRADPPAPPRVYSGGGVRASEPKSTPQDLGVVWDRTSGGEDEEQDAAAQAATTANRAAGAGFRVIDTYHDEDVPGDTPWEERPGMRRALQRARELGAVFVTRSPSRLWRGRPAQGILLAESIPDLEILGKAHWQRRGGAWVHDEDGDELYRLIDAHQAWAGKRGIREETQLAMTEIKEGRRATKSGRPPGRPAWTPIPIGLDAAATTIREGKSQQDAVEAYRHAAGYYRFKDPDARATRDCSRRSLMRAVAAQYPDLGKTLGLSA